MTQLDVTRSLIALMEFRPPDGIDYAIACRPEPGDCRVVVLFAAIEGESFPVEIPEPPDEPALRHLYRIAEAVLEDAWDSTVGEGPQWAKALGLNLKGIGADE